MPDMPLLISKEKLAELTTTSGPKGKYIAKDGLSWVALNKDDDKPFIESVKTFETFEMALRWLHEQK